jgi:hypothetical protein
MAYSSVTIPADGTTDTFTFSFKYLHISHVSAFKNGVKVTTATFPTASSVKLNTTVANGDTILIQRVTPRDKLTVEMPNSGTFRGRDINAMALQTLYIAQEVFDSLSTLISLAVDNTMDALGHRVSNVADPVNDQDAVTKKWAETSMTSTLAEAIVAKDAAKASQTSAAASEATATTKAATATTQAGIATTKAGEAATSAAGAASSKTAADADAAATAADRAAVAADKLTVAGYKVSVAGDKTAIEEMLDGFVAGVPTAPLVQFTPAGNLASTNVQAALQELDAEKAAASALAAKQDKLGYTPVNKAGDTMTGDLTVYRAGAPNTGVVFLGNSGGKYLFFDGTSYTLPAAELYVWGQQVWRDVIAQQKLAAMPLGGVGTTAFLYSFPSVDWGGLYAGSDLHPAGAATTSNPGTPGQAGTWKCLGYSGGARATLFLRVA